MNSTRTFSYKKIHPSNEKRNETMKSNVLQDLRINGFHIDLHHFPTEGSPKNTSKNSSVNWTNQNRPEQKLEDEIQEVSLKMTSRSVTRLQEQNVSENITVLKKEATSTRSSPGRRNKIHQVNNKIDEKLRNLYSQVEGLCVSCTPKKRKNRPHVKETKTMRTRTEDPLFNYSLKLMEMYLRRYKSDSDKASSREPSPVKPLPKKKRYGSNSTENVLLSNSKGIERWMARTGRKEKVNESCSLFDDKFVEPTRDRQNTDNLEEYLNDKKINSESSEKETNEGIESDKRLFEALKLKKSYTQNENSNTENNNFDLNNVHLLEDEKLTNVTSLKAEEDLLDKINYNSSFQKFNDYDKKLIPESDNYDKIDDVNVLTIGDDILTKAKEKDETENLGTYSNTDFSKTEEFRSNQASVKSNGSEILKSTLNSEDLESTKIFSNEEKVEMAMEKPENKQDNFNEDMFNNLFNENFLSMTIDNEKEKKQDSQGARLEMTENEIDSLKSGTITQEVTENDDDYKDINICKMLTDVHEQLTYDLQRMKRMEAKLQGKVSVDATNLTMALQLLDRTVARCKSYIHGSSNNQEAELYIAKVLSVYGVQLVTAVNKNKAALDEQAQQIERIQLGRNINNKKSVFREINSSWNYWKKEIIFLIEIIYNWVKHVMMNNEEKENVNLRKYKNIHRRTANSLFNYDLKSKPGDSRLKGAKFDLKLIKKESVVDTQMSIASHLIDCLTQSKSKASEKPSNSVVNRERGKTQNDAQMIEKRTIDKGKFTKDPIRNKYRAFGNQQPVWKPGGIVKNPASISATTLQKARPSINVKEKIVPPTEHVRTDKPTKTTNGSKKKVLKDALSMKDVTVHPRKIVGKRSNTSLRINPKTKSKPGTPKATPRNCSEPVHFENKSSQENSHEKDLQNSKAIRMLEENTGNTIQGDSTIVEPPLEPILPEKMLEDLYDNKEEPTRDMDSNQQQNQTTEKSLDTLSLYQNPLDLPKNLEYDQSNPSKKLENVIDAGINTSFERFQSNRYPNFVSVVSKSCLTNLSSNSDCTSKLECLTSYNSTCSSYTSNPEQKSDRLNLPVRDEEKDESMNKKEKNCTNSHAMLLNMLKEFLCEQGVDVGLVNKAEQKVKDKQKHRRYSKRKSTAFTTGFFSAQDDRNLQEDSESERLLQKDEENIDREKDSKNIEEKDVVNSENRFECTENSKGDGINWEKDLKLTENVKEDDVNLEKNCRTTEICEDNVVSCERGIQFTEDVINCKESCKESVISFEKNSKSTEIDEENFINREKGSQNTEKYEKNVINCENGSKHTETVTSREKEETNTESYEENLRPTEIYEDTGTSCKKNLNYTAHEENIANCAENVIKQTGSYEENDIECTKNSRQVEENNYKDILNDIEKYIANKPPENHIDNINIINVSLQPKMQDASSYIQQKSNDVFSQTDCQNTSLRSLQTMTQVETKDVRNISTECSTKNLTNENRTVSVMVESLPVDSKKTTRASSVSKSVITEHVGSPFPKSFGKPIHENLKEKSNSFFIRLLTQMQEESRSFEGNDASKEASFVESNASTSFISSDSSSKSLKDYECDEKVFKETNTSPIKIVSSETMAAFQVFAIRIQNIYKAVEIYQRKLKNELKRTEKKLKLNKAAKACKKKPRCVSKSSSVDMIFSRNDKICKDSVIQMYEAFRQAEAESMFDEESSYASDDDEQEASESLTSSSTTMWSYESASGKVELKISGKLSDTVVRKDVTHLMEFLVQKTEDSVKIDSVKKMSNNACKKNRNKAAKFSVFSRENLLPLIYGVVCYIVFWCLHFRITCDIVL